MAPATRAQALAKLASYDVKVGYPDTWADYSPLAIRRDAFWANVAAARRFGVDADRRRAGQRTSRSLWALPASSPDAYIDVQLNLMALPAGAVRPGLLGRAAGDLEKPVLERSPARERASLARQDQEGRLERVLRILLVGQHPPAHAQHHRPVPPQQPLERGHVAEREAAEQLAVVGVVVGRAADPAGVSDDEGEG